MRNRVFIDVRSMFNLEVAGEASFLTPICRQFCLKRANDPSFDWFILVNQADVDEHVDVIHNFLEDKFHALDRVTMQFYWHGPGAYRDAPQSQTLWMDAVRYSKQTRGWELDEMGPFPPVEKEKLPDFIREKDKLRQEAFWQASTNTFITSVERPELKDLIGRRYPGEYIEVLANQRQWCHLAGSGKPVAQPEQQVRPELEKTVKQKKTGAGQVAGKPKFAVDASMKKTVKQDRFAQTFFRVPPSADKLRREEVDRCMQLVDSPRSKFMKGCGKKRAGKPVGADARPPWNRYW